MKVTETVFLELFEKFKNTVYAVIFNYVRNAEDAKDLLQEVFLKLLGSDAEYKDEEHVKAWLIRVSVNMSKNYLRSRKRLSDEPLSEEIPAKEQQGQNELLSMVLALPEKYRVPLHLFYYEEYSVKQIANVMELPEATVKIRLKRGREKLGQSLRKEEWF
ncbi:MAG: sigma-70 family RNA polymerase sigma factor [Lachnospiraceae bacterium]|nr:sigma-70 family RNA polymerase sigma factor [Lachnospiraceae bacterium]